MSVWTWIQSFWKPGDFNVVPQSQNATVGRITQLTDANVYDSPHKHGANKQKPSPECNVYVRPIAEKIKALQLEATRKRRLAQVKSKPKRRPKAKP